MSLCKACARPIMWVSTATGQRLPLDPDPVPDGSVLLMPHGRCRIVPVEERAKTIAPLYKAHFATCPVAEEMRSPHRHSKGRPQ